MFNKSLVCLLIVFVLMCSGCLIKGRVVDQNGAGVEGITVYLSTLMAPMTTTTDSDGYYQFGSRADMLSLGFYTVMPSGNFTPATRYVTITEQPVDNLKDVPRPVYGVNFKGMAEDKILFNPRIDYDVDPSPYSVAIGDLNGDGYPDMAVPRGLFIIVDTPAFMNSESDQDLTVANYELSNVSVLLNNGDGTFKPAVNYGAGDRFNMSVAISDLDGDGHLDLAVTSSINTVSVLLGNGDGTFKTAISYGTDISPSSLAIGDLNEDGYPDLAVATSYSDMVSVLLGNGDGTFNIAVNYGTGDSPRSLAIGDLDGDGDLDLAMANAGSDTVSVLLGNGDGTFNTVGYYSAGLDPFSLTIGDLNKDGSLDIAVANAGSESVSVLLGNGDGTFETTASYGVKGKPFCLAIGDLDRDGNLDLAVMTNSGFNEISIISVLPGNGDGTFNTAVNYGTGNNPTSVAIDDLDGDGYLDLAMTSPYNNTVSVLLNKGNH
jgi:hypothetical protein